MEIKIMLNELNSWDEFQNGLLDLQKKKKGDAFELLTKLYFKIDPALSDYYDEVWLLSEVPQKELEYLGLPSHDLGIDLIAKSSNEYHAIQCKYHSKKATSVTFKEVATFISLLESNDKISQGYICSSSNITSRNYNKLETKPINLILADTWQTLNHEFFDQVRNLLYSKKYSPKPYSPKVHQEKAIEQAVKYFKKEKNSRGKLIFPCGSGKSLTGFWMTQELKSNSTIIAVPSLALVKQTLDVYLREIVANNRKIKWLCICSDEGIGRNDDVVFKTENLGVPCQTDPEYIENWLKENINEEKMIFTTYQSGRIIAEVSRKLDFTFDIGIFDEAHKTVGSSKKLFSHLLFDKNISINKRIFMTATERFYAGSKDDIISMDDYDTYGDIFDQLSFKEAIELELLTDYKVITIDIKKSEIADFIKNNNLVQLNDKWKKETEARSLASMLALRKAMKQFPIKNAVSFHSSIEKAIRNKELQEYITDAYNYRPIDTYTVSGKMPTTKRNDIVQEFASSDKALITNARCLTEGVDVPNIDCIVFADPRKSRVDIVQALGRALRKKEGKDWGYVILPIIYDETTDEIDNENFNEILAVVRGLASNDERIVEYFKDKSKGKKKENNERLEQFNFEVFSEYLDEDKFIEQLQIKLWNKLARLNWMSFEEARRYVHELNFKDQKEWRDYCLSGNKPLNIPSNPNRTYKDKSWKSWGDWLGTKIDFYGFLSFEESRKYVRKLNLNNQTEWIEYCKSGKKPFDIPRTPDSVYRHDGWVNLGDWLGTSFIATINREYLPFAKARKFVWSLGLKSQKGWYDYCDAGNKPDIIPRNSSSVYQDKGWISWSDWLGTKIGFSGDFKPFTEAKLLVHELNFNRQKEWLDYCKSGDKPFDIPSTPEKVYKNRGWQDMGDWLGSGIIATKNREYLSFEEAKLFVQSLGLNGQKEWIEYCKSGDKPSNIPRSPEPVYINKGWVSLGDWLGTGFVATQFREYLPFARAREIVRKLGFKNVKQWELYSKSGKKPSNLPSKPQTTYLNSGWKSWGYFLGTETISNLNREYRTFEEARNFVHKLNLNDQKEWQEYCKSRNRPKDIPSKPARVYKNIGWNGLRDWLGTIFISTKINKYITFIEARKIVHEQGLKNNKDWREYCKYGNKPVNIPNTPENVYKEKGWSGWGDFLGTGTIPTNKRNFRTFEEARGYVRKLNLNSEREWKEFCMTGKKPDDISSSPRSIYKNKGWKGWRDFLGKD